MKSTKVEAAALAAAEVEAKKATVAAKREAASVRKRERELAKDIWHQTTKIVVPAWFGNCDVDGGFKLGKTFTVAGLLALVSVGKQWRSTSETSSRTQCEVGLQMDLRPSGFGREEARGLARRGFLELKNHKLVRLVKKPTDSFPYGYYTLSAKGRKWFELIEESAGCTPDTEA